jgi:dUTP pyrophosphatase
VNVNIRKVKPTATIPTYATEGASGFDLYAAESVFIEPGETKVIQLGLVFEIPEGHEMQIRPRSGFSKNTKLRVQLGTIDADYRGEVGIIIDNIKEAQSERLLFAHELDEFVEMFMDGTYIIRTGDRIAQGVIAPVSRVSFVETDEELTQTERGDRGFGSTGINAEVTE